MERLKIAFNRMINDLNEEDTFQIVAFSTKTTKLYKSFQKNKPGRIAKAIQNVSKLSPGGGTNIHGALMDALKIRNRV